MSTNGFILAKREAATPRPGAVSALLLLIAAEAILWTALGAIALVTQTPVRAIVGAAAAVVFIGAAVLAHRGLGLGQAWALTFAIALAFVTVASGVVEMSNAPAGTTTISITAIIAAGILIWLERSREQVRQFVEGSHPIGRRLGLALAAAVVAPALIGASLPVLPDPTQAVASDVDMRLSMACGHRDIRLGDGTLLRDRQVADLSVDMFWHRSDFLPHGLRQILGVYGEGDTAGFRILSPEPIDFENGGAMPSWMLAINEPDVIVAETGEVAGWFGSTTPSVALIPDTMGAFTVGVEPDQIQAGRTIHIGWSLGPGQDGTQAWPTAEVAYAHLDRFVLIGSVGCGQHTTGSADVRPAPAQEQFLP